jgi:hypothetical protein
LRKDLRRSHSIENSHFSLLTQFPFLFLFLLKVPRVAPWHSPFI